MVSPSKSPGAAISIEELAARARAGSRESFAEIVVRSRPQLVAFLARRLASPADAEDVAQETFLRAYDALDRYEPGRPFQTWLFAIGKNLAANHAVARTRRAAHEHAAATPASLAVSAPTLAPAPAEATAPAAEPGAAGDLWQHAARVLRPDAYRMLWL
ncbi:MAG TPA: sigma factor, partial [Kofleriaceae bacterium]|nr:sigma factor [Kofleriaceae bacterium]